MTPESPNPSPRWSLPVKQTRAQKTRDRLLAAGFKLLRKKNFDELSVADIAKSAGCAVGSFYLRFADKDQYFLAIAETRRGQSRARLENWYDGATLAGIVSRAIERELDFVLEHPNLWRAALKRGTTDPQFWEEFRELGRLSVARFIDTYSALIGRAVSAEESENIRFAFQVVRGTVNNTLINQPGPLRLDDPAFRRQIERAFRLVGAIDNPKSGRAKAR